MHRNRSGKEGGMRELNNLTISYAYRLMKTKNRILELRCLYGSMGGQIDEENSTRYGGKFKHRVELEKGEG